MFDIFFGATGLNPLRLSNFWRGGGGFLRGRRKTAFPRPRKGYTGKDIRAMNVVNGVGPRRLRHA